jgi:hypothetical protein
MSRLVVRRCPGCGREVNISPPLPPWLSGNELWCTACDQRLRAVARTTLPGTLGRVVGTVAGWLERASLAAGLAGRLESLAVDLNLAADAVAQDILQTPAWFRGKLAD